MTNTTEETAVAKKEPRTELVPMSVADLPVQIARQIDNAKPMVSEAMVRAALTQTMWAKAFASGGIAAIAQALVICAQYNLSPVGKNVYIAEFEKGIFTAFPSADGMLSVANQRDDFDGAVDGEIEIIDGRVHFHVMAYRKGRKHGTPGHGYKPLIMKKKKWGDKGPDGKAKFLGWEEVEDPHAESNARKMALRRAMTELYEGCGMPAVSADAQAWLDREGEDGIEVVVEPREALAPVAEDQLADEAPIGPAVEETPGTEVPPEPGAQESALMVTQKQQSLIAVLAKNNELTRVQVRAMAGVSSLKELTSEAASVLIDKLQATATHDSAPTQDEPPLVAQDEPVQDNLGWPE